MRDPAPQRLAHLALAGAFALAVASFFYWAAWAFGSNDTAWLMRTGQYIVAHGRLPAHDLFSWTCPDRPYMAYQWLFEVLLALVFRAGGAHGLWLSGMAATVAAGVVYFYLLPGQWLRFRAPLFIAFPLAALALSPPWFFIRPQLVSHLFIPIFVDACERLRRTGDAGRLWYLPLIMVIWANMHPLWVVGLVIVAAYAVPDLFSPRPARAAGPRWAPAAVLAACACFVLANPYGPGLISYELYFQGQTNFKAVNELRPLIDHPSPFFYPFLAYLVLSWAALLARAKRVPLPGLLLSGFGSAAALAMNKFAPVAVLLTWPYVGCAVAGLCRSAARGRLAPLAVACRQAASRWFSGAGRLRLALLSVLVSVACFEARIPTADYATIIFAYNDVETFRFMAAHRFPSPRIFNDEPTGSLLIYFGLGPVFADGRVDFYGQEFCRQWIACVDGEPGWQDYLSRYRVTQILIADNVVLYDELARSPRWLRVYDNGMRSLWLTNDRSGRDTLRHWRASLGRRRPAR